jgi:hypothetical protein
MFHVFFFHPIILGSVLINGSVILAAPLRASINHQRRRFSVPVFRVANLVRDQTSLPVGLRSGSFDRVLDMWWAMGPFGLFFCHAAASFWSYVPWSILASLSSLPSLPRRRINSVARLAHFRATEHTLQICSLIG